MKSYYYKGDPYWTSARFNSTCPCGDKIEKGESIFYYPKGKKAYCAECGESESARFEGAALDEYLYNS